MSLFSTLRTGASGLGASGKNLAVIGDNIANINTVGYKGSRATFADAIPQAVASLGGPKQLGSGSVTSNVLATFSQGMIQNSSSALDVALQGRGFFQVANGAERYYTRDGSFVVDNDGWMVNSSGLRVQGYQATNGNIGSTIGDIRLDTQPIPQQETSAITIQMQLDGSLDPADSTSNLSTLQTAGSLDGATTLLRDVDADFSTSVAVYDSLGRPHDVTIFFEKTDADTWSYSAMVDGGETDVTGAADGMALEIMSGTMDFDTDGNLIDMPTPTPGPAWTWPGADVFTFDLQLGLDGTGNTVPGAVRMADSESTVATISQDGYTTGNLTQVRVDSDGTVNASYTNGKELVLGQLAVALFQADNGLERVGGNLFRATSMSGDPALGAAGSGGRGVTTGYALERSNVELEDEFVQMIQSQRSYQANAGVIRTADETLQELVNLV